MKKLFKSTTDKKLCGVCGGLAKYLDVDPTIVRLGTFVFTWCFGIGLVAYIAAALILPTDNEVNNDTEGTIG